MNLSFPIGRLFGIQIRIHWFFPLLIGMYLLRGATEPGGGPLLVGFFAALMAGQVLTTIVHEFGHCFAARSVGGHADQIVIWPLGGFAYVGHGGAPRHDLKIAAMGPLTHLPMGALCAGLLLIWVPWSWSYLNPLLGYIPFYPVREYFVPNLLHGLLRIQIILLAFNLFVPAYPLDGGRILNNLLLMRYGRERAAAVSTYVSIPIGIAILMWAFMRKEFLMGFFGVQILYDAWQIRTLLAQGLISEHPMFGAGPEFDYMPDRPQRKGFFARWKEKRARKAQARDAALDRDSRLKVDEVLDKVSREGIGSLSSDEKRILDDASRRSRGER